MQYLDIGGGLGIDYYRGTKSDEAPISSVADLIRAVASALPPDVNLILEPGRSLVANAGAKKSAESFMRQRAALML